MVKIILKEKIKDVEREITIEGEQSEVSEALKRNLGLKEHEERGQQLLNNFFQGDREELSSLNVVKLSKNEEDGRNCNINKNNIKDDNFSDNGITTVSTDMNLIQKEQKLKPLSDLLNIKNFTQKDNIMVFGYYIKKNDFFSRKDILNKYKSLNRDTKSIIGNFKTSINSLINEEFIESNEFNNDTIKLTLKGIKKAKDLIFGENTEKKLKVNKRPKLKKNLKSFKFEMQNDLELNSLDKTPLKEFLNKYDKSFRKSTPKTIMIIMKYLDEVLKKEEISINMICTAMSVCNIPIVSTFKQIMVNLRTRKWVSFKKVNNTIAMTIMGKNLDFLSSNLVPGGETADGEE